jgi:peptidoglycan hydrolase-like protein with peptidoglycan-binding domain
MRNRTLISEVIKKELKKIYILKEQSEDSTFLKNFERIIQSNKTYKNLKTETSKIPYSEDVEDIQIALQFLGFSLPKWGIDGLFGPETETSVKDFQKERGLTQTGVLDKKGLQEIYDMLIEEDFKDSDLSSIEKEYKFDTAFTGKIGTAKDVIDFLMGKGLSLEQSVGITANLQQESSLNPNAVGDNGTSFGIAQWHNERGQNMMKWTESKGYKSNSLEGQLEFLWYELSTDYKNVLDEIKRTYTSEDAAEVFVRKYEKPGNIENEVSKRSSIAGSLYNKVSDMA